MKLGTRSPEEVTYAAVMARGERHQLNWTIDDGTITPRLTCLHGTLPEGMSCTAQTVRESPELLVEGYDGAGQEARDGIIVSRWVGGGGTWDGGSELVWHYEDEDRPPAVATQRHTLRFIIGGEDVEPVFECLHPAGTHCDAEIWREDITCFPGWHVGPDAALRAGSIVSWWSSGEPNDDGFPHWAYEDHAAGAVITTCV